MIITSLEYKHLQNSYFIGYVDEVWHYRIIAYIYYEHHLYIESKCDKYAFNYVRGDGTATLYLDCTHVFSDIYIETLKILSEGINKLLHVTSLCLPSDKIVVNIISELGVSDRYQFLEK